MEGIFILFTYALIMVTLTFKDKVSGSLEFNVANRKIGTLGGALSIAATWIWAPALFVSAEKAYLWGFNGLAWFLIPNILCLIIFMPFADEIRRIFPNGVTLSGFMEKVYGSRKVGNVYRFQLGALAVLSTGVQLLAGGKILSIITGIPFFYMTVILSVIAYSYSRKSGILASVKTDALQMILIILICAVAVPWAIHSKGFGAVSGGLAGVADVSGWEVFIGFGLPTAIGLISGPFGDQCFWQRAFAIEKDSIKKSFIIGALIFGLVPLAMGVLGFIAAGSGFIAENSGFVNFELIKAILPAWFMVPVVRVSHADKSGDIYGTITHNRARGVHLLEPMKKIVKELLNEGKTIAEIGKEIGMKPEEVFRLSDFSRDDFLNLMTNGVQGFSKAETIRKV